MASAPDDLARLSAREREVLALLAQGHTAKSIAATLGITVGAVNERLREARRKTGAASSRDLARRYAQENRDEEIGVPANGRTLEGAVTPQRRGVPRGTVMVVTASAIAFVTLLAVQAMREPAGSTRAALPAGTSDAAIEAILPDPGTSAGVLYRAVRTEERDAMWAGRAERVIRTLLGQVEGLPSGSAQVRCATTICEASALLLSPESTMLKLQQVIRAYGPVEGAANASIMFGGGRYLAYWRKTGIDASPAGPPRVIATAPVDKATIPAGPFALSVTFDRPMRRDSYSIVTTDLGTAPDCAPDVTVSPDGRTFSLRCTAKAGVRYSVGINYGRYRNFVDAAGRAADAAVIGFSVR